MSEVIAIVVLTTLVIILLTTAWSLLNQSSRRRTYARTVRSMRLWMIPVAVAGVVLVCTAAVWLTRAWPILGWGWWRLMGGSGSVAFGQTAFNGAQWRCLGLALPILLALLVPWFAHEEEIAFRYGSEHDSWPRRLRTQTVFGLAHPVFMGVPVAAGLALILAGLLFQVTYLVILKKLVGRLPQTTPTPLPLRVAYPTVPEGPSDPGEWRDHIDECHVISIRNHRLIEDWAEVELKRIEDNETRLINSRLTATAATAAVHAIYNWLLLGLLILALVAIAS